MSILNFTYTGSVQTAKLSAGSYILECWGAEGGRRSVSTTSGGKGGYSRGTITLTNDTNIFVYVGGFPGTSNISVGTTILGQGGFNGGGKRYAFLGGGGASDIRIGQDSLYARVIVAGGGGSVGAENKKGGYGGGQLGQSITDSYGNGGGGASQIVGGAGHVSNTLTYGTFGQGGQGFYANGGYGGAGGGGWYGGAGSYPDSSADDDKGGGGGSGWVWTGINAPPDGWLLDSKYHLSGTSMLDGSQTFLSPSGINEIGHSGNGYIRISEAKMVDFVYPVGSIYMSVNPSNPEFLMGGKWSSWGHGRVPLAIGNNGENNYTAPECTGGSENGVSKHSHTIEASIESSTILLRGKRMTEQSAGPLLGAVITDSTRNAKQSLRGEVSYPGIVNRVSRSTTDDNKADQVDLSHDHDLSFTIADKGTDNANCMPYITCYMWKRIS